MSFAFGRWVLAYRGARIGLIAGLLPLPLTGVLSAAIVVAVAISKGWRVAATDCAIAMLVLVAVTIIAGGGWTQVAASGLSTWVVAILLGTVTGLYASLALTLQVLIVVSLIGLTAFVVLSDDPIMFWEAVLTGFAAQMQELGVELNAPDVLVQLAPIMTGLVGVSVITSSMLALVIGAWWAGGNGGPAFREMFVNIRLGYVLGVLAVIAGVAALMLPGQLASNAMLLLGIGFVIQGLSVVHWLVSSRGLPGMVLIPVYLPIFMGASITVMMQFLLATAGFVDNWYGLRRGPVGER